MNNWEESTVMYILDMCKALNKGNLKFLKDNIEVMIENLESEEE